MGGVKGVTMSCFDSGIYVNLFPVEICEREFELMAAPRASFQDLRLLREWIKTEHIDVCVYADGKTVYGYGPEKDKLETQGFQRASWQFTDVPRLATRIIIEGLVGKLKSKGYEILPRKGRWRAYHPKQSTEVAERRIRVYRGYDLRAIFWKDIATNNLAFGLIVDVFWLLKDSQGQPLSMSLIRRQYGYQATIAIAQVQQEYLPGSNKLNTEVARQRFHDHILPFVQIHSAFDLPCGGQARLLGKPVRVILGDEEK